MGAYDGKIVLTAMGHFNQRKITREVFSSPDSPSHTVKTFTKVGASDYETKGCVLRSGNHTPCAKPTGGETDTTILINDESSRMGNCLDTVSICPSTLLPIAPSKNRRDFFLSFFFLFLLLHSLYTSYIVVKTCVKRCVILYVVFVLTISQTPSKYW